MPRSRAYHLQCAMCQQSSFSEACLTAVAVLQWNVVFFGRHDLKGSLKWMGTFWLSIAGLQPNSSSQAPDARLLEPSRV